MARPRPGFKPSNGFKPGQVANPRGRGAGSRGKYSKNIWQMIDQRRDRDPIDVISEYVTSNTVDPALKLQAAGMLASYKYGKRPSYRYIEDITGLKPPQSVAEATAYQSKVAALVAEGKLDVDGGLALKDMLQSYVDMKTASELEQRMQQAEALIQELMARGYGSAAKVIGGLPELPGTTIILPAKNSELPPIADNAAAADARANPWAVDVAAQVQPKPASMRKDRFRSAKRRKWSDPLSKDPDGVEEPQE
jgi:hypothetical protein